MIGGSILNDVQSVVRRGLRTLGAAIARVTKPIAQSPSAGIIADLARSKPQLVAENMVLRQQFIVLNRSVKGPRFTRADRAIFVLLASRVHTWKDALLIVKPETVLASSGLAPVLEAEIAGDITGTEAPRRDDHPDQGDGH